MLTAQPLLSPRPRWQAQPRFQVAVTFSTPPLWLASRRRQRVRRQPHRRLPLPRHQLGGALADTHSCADTRKGPAAPPRCCRCKWCSSCALSAAEGTASTQQPWLMMPVTTCNSPVTPNERRGVDEATQNTHSHYSSLAPPRCFRITHATADDGCRQPVNPPPSRRLALFTLSLIPSLAHSSSSTARPRHPPPARAHVVETLTTTAELLRCDTQ